MSEWSGNPWERQKGESEKAYEAFCLFRDMGEERTVSAVVKKLGKSRALLDRWRERWKWRERVRLYDNALEKEAYKKAVSGKRKMVQRHIDLSLKLQRKATEALERMNVDDMSPRDVREYIKMATELERLNRMLDTQQYVKEEESDMGLADAIVNMEISEETYE